MKNKQIKIRPPEYTCSCGERYTHDGWNLEQEQGQGNNYHYKTMEGKSIKYTRCSKCGRHVKLNSQN